MKYEFTGETKEVAGVTLRRVRYPDTGELGGWIESEANLSQEGDARVSGDAWVCGGEWKKSPLQIQGTRFFFSVSSPDSITVGCTTKKVSKWLESYERDFDKHRFTEPERIEYKLYFNLAAILCGWDVPLFPVGAAVKEAEE